jgi:hypothetical protein
MVTFHLPTKRIRAVTSPTGQVWVASLDGGDLPGEFASAIAATRELDWLAFYTVFADQRLRPSLITDEAITLAAQVFRAFFRTPAQRASADKALTRYLHDAAGRARWRITPDGLLEVQPTRASREPYHVRHQPLDDHTEPREPPYQVQETCTCPDAAYREADHAGMCKHVALRVLLVIAQLGVARLKHLIEALRASTHEASLPAVPPAVANLPAAPTTVAAPLPIPCVAQDEFAFVELDALLLVGALFVVRTANQTLTAPIQVSAQMGQIELALSGQSHLVRLVGRDGAGSCVTQIEPAPFELIWKHARALSQALKHQPVQLFLSAGDLVLCAPGSDPEEAGGTFTLTSATSALAIGA